MAFLTQEEFALFQQYGEKYAYEYPGAHEQLRSLYDKLGKIADAIKPYGFITHIRRNPQNQGQRYESYHWAQIVPRNFSDAVGKIFYVIDFTSNGFGTHIDCAQRNGYSINDRTKNYQGWESISVEKVCEMEIKDIVTFVLDYCHRHRRDFLCFGKEYNIKSCIKLLNMEKHIDLLKSNKNLILTGAPGTGKTYLAQQIAKEIGCCEAQIGFVQFHPSYDYTDFVEGLRPKQDDSGNIGFEPKDGIFKKFCENALQTYLSDANNAPKYVFIIDEINRGEISKIFGELFFSIDSGYRVTKGMIDDHRSGKSPLVTIRTQYSNMCKRPNAFDEALGITDANDFGHFFVPDNVYIIGTMNDIDRSVESMDFAFRRRFAFKEIKASENLGMLDDLEDKDNIIKRMENLNAAIEKVEGLSSAYHIGGSYFMKLKLYQNEDKSYDYDSLWNNHLEGLLMEYLRGMADAEKKVKELKEYYDLK